MIAIVMMRIVTAKTMTNKEKGLHGSPLFLPENKGLYIHIPFCRQKCRYCDFVSFSGKEELQKRYLDALETELTHYRHTPIDTIFIGGGTPTCLSDSLLDRLLSIIHSTFSLSEQNEFSIEANPGTLTKENIHILSDHGVNRVSVGVQSFCDAELRLLGRIHTADEAKRTIAALQDAGIENVNIDLMSALPNQTPDALYQNLSEAISCRPAHISCYSLIIEEGTPFAADYEKGELTLPDDDTDRLMYHMACNILAENGYNQYEISNFARHGYECRHNIRYWRCLEYIGCGVAAHSYLNGARYFHTSNLNSYLQNPCEVKERVVLSNKDKIQEFMIMGLRMTDGVNETEFLNRFGIPLKKCYGPTLKKFTDNGLLLYQNGHYLLSERGIDISNSVLCEFV